MKNFILSLILSFASLFGYHQPVQTPVVLGAFTPVQGTQFYLAGAGITATANTVQLTSFQTPDGRNLTMNMFGATGYGSLEPGTSKLEDITFTGITQNGNGTATLTGVSRGMDFVSPYTASTTLAKAHSGGATFILSNTAGFYGNQFLFANNTGTSTATLVFSSTTPPTYDADPIWANFSTQILADVAYVNSVVAAGAANASETVKGIIQLATGAQAAAGISSGSTGARLALGANLASSTPSSATPTGTIPTTVGQYISQLFLNLTQAFTFSTTTQYVANVGTLTATSSATVGNLTVSGTVTASALPVVLVSTTTSQAMAQATTTFAAYNNLQVYFSLPGYGSDTVCLNFNQDFTSNYSMEQYKDYAFLSKLTGTLFEMGAANGATTTDATGYFVLNNPAAKRKQVPFYSVSESDSALHPPILFTGSGLWNNTSAQVTTIVFNGSAISGCGFNIPSGSTIRVIGFN